MRSLKNEPEVIKAVNFLGQIITDGHDPVERVTALCKLNGINDSRAIPFYLKALRNKDEAVRLHAVIFLAQQRRNEKLEDIFIGLLNHDDPHVLYVAIETLGKYGAERAVEPLIELLEGDNEKIQDARVLKQIIRSLGEIGNDRAVKFLSERCFLSRQVES
jgi:HEAT repeat protein